MAKKPKIPKNADFSQVARAVVDAATSETEDEPESSAVIRGRMGGEKGGKARADKMTAEERSASARKAATARWSKKKSSAD